MFVWLSVSFLLSVCHRWVCVTECDLWPGCDETSVTDRQTVVCCPLFTPHRKQSSGRQEVILSFVQQADILAQQIPIAAVSQPIRALHWLQRLTSLHLVRGLSRFVHSRGFMTFDLCKGSWEQRHSKDWSSECEVITTLYSFRLTVIWLQ